MSAKFPRKNPDIKWEVPKGRDLSNLVLTQGGVDERTKFRLIPEHLKPIAGKIQHLTRLLENEIALYDRELSKCEVVELRRIQQNERKALKDAQAERIEKARKKILKSYVGNEKILAKQTGLTKQERRAQAFQEFLKSCAESGMEIPDNIRQNVENIVNETKKKFGENF